jgi:hypothetical protein
LIEKAGGEIVGQFNHEIMFWCEEE